MKYFFFFAWKLYGGFICGHIYSIKSATLKYMKNSPIYAAQLVLEKFEKNFIVSCLVIASTIYNSPIADKKNNLKKWKLPTLLYLGSFFPASLVVSSFHQVIYTFLSFPLLKNFETSQSLSGKQNAWCSLKVPKLRYDIYVNGSEYANVMCGVWCVSNMCVFVFFLLSYVQLESQIVYSGWILNVLNVQCSC